MRHCYILQQLSRFSLNALQGDKVSWSCSLIIIALFFSIAMIIPEGAALNLLYDAQRAGTLWYLLHHLTV